MNAPVHLNLELQGHAAVFVNALYHAIRGDDPDPEVLATSSAFLARTGDLVGTARLIADSAKVGRGMPPTNSEALVAAAFRGLLEREAEPEALLAYGRELEAHRDPEVLLRSIRNSEEHWQRLLSDRAEAVITAIYQALLKREPDSEALAVYARELRATGNLAALLAAIGDSDEHREIVLRSRAPATPPIPTEELPSLLAKLLRSKQLWNELGSIRNPNPGPAFAAYDTEAWVFVHAQKTGGTSLQAMLVDIFGDSQVYREHADTLYLRSPADLASYSIFTGHFDFDTVRYIPRARRRLFTILREPRERLLSHYRFLRAHQPGSPSYQGEMEIANRLEAPEFFRSHLAYASCGFWNHLTWCVMGQRKWYDYQRELPGLDVAELLLRLADIRAEIRSRLLEFEFVGLQEDFPHTCERLFGLIGAGLPHVRHEHSIELLAANQAAYFKYIPRGELNPGLESLMADLVQLDDIVYQEGTELYRVRYGRSVNARAAGQEAT